MAGRAFRANARRVQRVIELHAEALERRKRFQRARFHVRVTDSADGAVVIRKLLRVTASARQMAASSRQSQARRVVFTTMTEQAWKLRVRRICVRELGKVSAAFL